MNNAVPNKANYSRHKPSDITTRQEASSFSQYQTPCESPISLPRIESHIEKSRSAYIANAEERVKLTERMLASDPKAHMKLDGGYGDYSMGIFRVKDRKRWLHDAPTLFTNEFRGKIIACFPNNTMDDRLLQEIINRPRSLQKDIAEEPIIAEPNKKDESSLTHRVNKLAEVQDNMNGYLTLKQYPQQPVTFPGLPAVPLENYSGVVTTIRPTQVPTGLRATSRFRTKDYMFKGLARFRRH